MTSRDEGYGVNGLSKPATSTHALSLLIIIIRYY